MLHPLVFDTRHESLKGEDGFVVERITLGDDSLLLVLLCDGHGGADAAALAIDALLPIFIRNANRMPSDLGAAATRAFAVIHSTLCDPRASPSMYILPKNV